MTAVLDSSAVLAAIFGEAGADIAERHIADGAVLGAVNLAEVASKLMDLGYSQEDLDATLEAFVTRSPAFDTSLAMTTARLRVSTRSAGLSLGDRACLSLAERSGAVAVTADRAWLRIEADIEVQVIR
jgi:ribonuclease VapC